MTAPLELDAAVGVASGRAPAGPPAKLLPGSLSYRRFRSSLAGEAR